MKTIKVIVEHEKPIIYAEWINSLEGLWKRGQLNTRLDMVNWCIEEYGYVDSLLMDLIEKLYADNFICR